MIRNPKCRVAIQRKERRSGAAFTPCIARPEIFCEEQKRDFNPTEAIIAIMFDFFLNVHLKRAAVYFILKIKLKLIKGQIK